jgi:two-component system OmpR family response regulator
MGPSVLVVCEDDLLGASICAHLARARINVQGARTLAEFKSSLDSWMFDIAVCDIDLPDGSGGEFIPQLRMTAGCGIIALSANPTRESRLLAMRLGADYHLAAPVDCEELELTIRSLHRWTAVRPRRSQGRAAVAAATVLAEPTSTSEEMVESRAGLWRVDTTHWKLISPEGRGAQLSFPEYQILQHLAQSPGQVAPRDDLLALLNRNGTRLYGRNLDMMMSRLRRKIQLQCNDTLPVHSARGVGYVFNGRAELLD